MATTNSLSLEVTTEEPVFQAFLHGSHEDYFAYIHYTGMGVASLSIICSIGLAVFLSLYSSGAKSGSSFPKWPLLERLFIHHAVINILFGACHLLDLMRIVAMESTLPTKTCRGFGVALNTLLLSDCSVAMFAGANSIMVVKRRRDIPLARYDHRLVVGLFIIPLLIGVILSFANIMGTSGVWCLADVSRDKGLTYSWVICVIVLCLSLVSVLVILCCACIMPGVPPPPPTPPGGRRGPPPGAPTFAPPVVPPAPPGPIRHMLSFPVISILRWTFLLGFYISITQQKAPFWLSLVTTITINLGGIHQVGIYTWFWLKSRPLSNPETKDQKGLPTIMMDAYGSNTVINNSAEHSASNPMIFDSSETGGSYYALSEMSGSCPTVNHVGREAGGSYPQDSQPGGSYYRNNHFGGSQLRYNHPNEAYPADNQPYSSHPKDNYDGSYTRDYHPDGSYARENYPEEFYTRDNHPDGSYYRDYPPNRSYFIDNPSDGSYYRDNHSDGSHTRDNHPDGSYSRNNHPAESYPGVNRIQQHGSYPLLSQISGDKGDMPVNRGPVYYNTTMRDRDGNYQGETQLKRQWDPDRQSMQGGDRIQNMGSLPYVQDIDC